MKLQRNGNVVFEADAAKVYYDVDTDKYVVGDESYDEIEVVVDKLPEGASIEVDDYGEADDYGEVLGADVRIKYAQVTIQAFVKVYGKGYHYSGRNSFGEWVEPEESGFEVSSIEVETAYFSDLADDVDIYDFNCVLGDDVVADIKGEIQRVLRY